MTKKPVVIGLGITQQKGSYAELDEALFLMEKVAMQAINDCGNSVSYTHLTLPTNLSV